METSVSTSIGASRMLTYGDNGDGVIDRRQVITKSTVGTGKVTELWTNTNGGGIKLGGRLRQVLMRLQRMMINSHV